MRVVEEVVVVLEIVVAAAPLTAIYVTVVTLVLLLSCLDFVIASFTGLT